MSEVRIDTELIDTFLTRGVVKIYPTRDALKEKLFSGQRIRAYQGFDPTGPFLHIGHAMGIRALRILQQLGHEVIFLVGDFTSLVGDPDQTTTRKILSEEQIEQNMAGWKEQASQLIDFEGENPVIFRRNYEWLSALRLQNLIELMSHTTVQQMIEREMFQKRLEQNDPIQLQEFIYPLMQGYDSVAMDVDLEIGGTDQTFNMLVGRTLMRKLSDKEKFVRTHELMEAPDALTMSKTKGNGINLGDDPEEMYGKAMSYPDELITKGLRLLTDIALDDIYHIEQEIENGANPMTFKKMMAYEIVKIIKGEKEAKKAGEHFEKTVQQGKISEDTALEIHVQEGISIFENLRFVVDENISNTEIRRIIEQGGVEVNNTKVNDPATIMEFKKGDMIKFGKRKFYKVV